MVQAINTSTSKNSFPIYDLKFFLFKMIVYEKEEKGAKTIKNTFSLPGRENKNFRKNVSRQITSI